MTRVATACTSPFARKRTARPNGGAGIVGPMTELTKQQRGCWAAWAYAPDGTTMRQANDAINALVADEARGLVLFHDHFADRAGGMAVFDIETPEQLAALRDPGPVEGWDYRVHPLIFAGGALRFLFQCDYTMKAYRDGRRLTELFGAYKQTDDCAKLDAD